MAFGIYGGIFSKPMTFIGKVADLNSCRHITKSNIAQVKNLLGGIKNMA